MTITIKKLITAIAMTLLVVGAATFSAYAHSDAEIAAAMNAAKEKAEARPDMAPAIDLNEVARLINLEREKAGLPSLWIDPSLAAAATVRAEEVSRCWAHIRPDGSEWWTAGEQNAMGENLAWGYDSPVKVVGWEATDEAGSNGCGWMRSDCHRNNILNPHFKSMNLAQYGWYIACEFG